MGGQHWCSADVLDHHHHQDVPHSPRAVLEERQIARLKERSTPSSWPQVDMQGRLMGKRFQAEFFLESAHQETHSCNYLLATDFEMETVPGYKATSWAAGYGDYVMKPDLSTLRRMPWLEGTALVLCDVLDHHGHARGAAFAAGGAEAADRPAARARASRR